MKRRLVIVAATLSLALCALLLVAWPLSYLPRDAHLGSCDGKVLLLFTDGQWTTFVGTREHMASYDDLWSMARSEAATHRSALGVEFVARFQPMPGLPRTGGTYGRFVMLAVPYPYLLLATGATGAWSVLVLRRQTRRARAGRCVNCGYNLAGNESGVCPECGTTLAPAPPPGR